MTTREGNWLYTSTNRLRQLRNAARSLVWIDDRLFDRELETWPAEIDADVETTEDSDVE